MNHINALQMLRMLGSSDFHLPAWKPSMDVYRSQRGWLLKFELAGVRLDDVRLEAQGCTVRLSGTRRDLMCGHGCEHQVMEIAYSRFERSVELPCNVSSARISTQISEGMLLVEIETS